MNLVRFVLALSWFAVIVSVDLGMHWRTCRDDRRRRGVSSRVSHGGGESAVERAMLVSMLIPDLWASHSFVPPSWFSSMLGKMSSVGEVVECLRQHSVGFSLLGSITL